jgi:inorganic pyrophosphatase
MLRGIIFSIFFYRPVAGNTTAAVGKGFAIGSAAIVSLALFGAFVVRIRAAAMNAKGGTTAANQQLLGMVEILHPLTFAFLLIGANLPYWFSAMTMRSVGEAAIEMVAEVERQFAENPELLNPLSNVRRR